MCSHKIIWFCWQQELTLICDTQRVSKISVATYLPTCKVALLRHWKPCILISAPPPPPFLAAFLMSFFQFRHFLCECAFLNLLWYIPLQILICMLMLMTSFPALLYYSLLWSVSPMLINHSLAYFESVGMCVICTFSGLDQRNTCFISSLKQ